MSTTYYLFEAISRKAPTDFLNPRGAALGRVTGLGKPKRAIFSFLLTYLQMAMNTLKVPGK
jgi:hypothetical protein